MAVPSTPPPALATNLLLETLTARDRARVLAACHEVALEEGVMIDEAGAAMPHVYFPASGFISLIARVGDDSLEVALTGNEGMYGIPVAIGEGTAPAQALVQGSGVAWRMGAASFRRELGRIPALRRLLDRYAFVVMSQLIQTAGCHHFHRIEQRLARWLLMTADRAHSSTLGITHEFLAYMLGVRRVDVTEAAGSLQKRRLIAYGRGVVTIRDRAGLERAACSCYRADLSIYEATLGLRSTRAGVAANPLK